MNILSSTLRTIGKVSYHGHKAIKSTKNIPSVKQAYKSATATVATGYAEAMIKDVQPKQLELDI